MLARAVFQNESSVLLDRVNHDGQTVEILDILPVTKYDNPVTGPLLKVRFPDGYVLDVSSADLVAL